MLQNYKLLLSSWIILQLIHRCQTHRPGYFCVAVMLEACVLDVPVSKFGLFTDISMAAISIQASFGGARYLPTYSHLRLLRH